MAKWLENAIFYEIYPQSFNDTNGDGIGDFQGIIEKLDYIKETGFNAIWMKGPIALLNCTRKPLFTCTCPLSSTHGTRNINTLSGSVILSKIAFFL